MASRSSSRSVRDRADGDRGDARRRASGTVDIDGESRYLEVELIKDNDRLRAELKEAREHVYQKDDQLQGMNAELEGLAAQLVAKSLEPGKSKEGDSHKARRVEKKLRRKLEEAKKLNELTAREAKEEVERVQNILKERDVELRGMNGVITGQSNRLRELEKQDVRRRGEIQGLRGEFENARKRHQAAGQELENGRREFEKTQSELIKTKLEFEKLQKMLDRTKEDHKNAVRSLNQMAASRKSKGEEYLATMASKEKELEDVRRKLAWAEEELQNARKQVMEEEGLRRKAEQKSTELTHVVEALKRDVGVTHGTVVELKNELALFKGQKGYYDLRLLGMSEELKSKEEALEEMKSTVQKREAEVNDLKKELELARSKKVPGATPTGPGPTGEEVSSTSSGRAALTSSTTSKGTSPGGEEVAENEVSGPNGTRSMSEKHKLPMEDIPSSPAPPNKKSKPSASKSSSEAESGSEESSSDDDDDSFITVDDLGVPIPKKLDCVGGAVADLPGEGEATSNELSSPSHSISMVNSDSGAEGDEDDEMDKASTEPLLSPVANSPEDESNLNEGSESVEADDMSESPDVTTVDKTGSDSDDDVDVGKEDYSGCVASTNVKSPRSENESRDDEVLSNDPSDSEDDWKWGMDFSEEEDEVNPPAKPVKKKSADGVSSKGKLATPRVRIRRGLLSSRPHGRNPDPEKPFFCICGGDYGETSLLLQHIRYFQKGKPYSCDSCGRTFSTKGNLKTHKKSRHPVPATE